jgi:glutamyl-tRNA reductase
MSIKGFRQISADFDLPSAVTEERARLADLKVHGWDTASLSPAALHTLEAEIPASLGWRDGVAIVTCQRHEFVSLDKAPGGSAPRSYEGEAALLHIASLAAGLDSLVLGETQIFGQVRGALAHAGVEAAGRLLVLGGGVMARRVLERAVGLGFEVTVAARRPVTLSVAATYVPLDQVASLEPFDVVAGCLGAGAPRMDCGHLPPITRLAVDFGTPRSLGDDFETPVVTIANLIDYQATTPLLVERRDVLRRRLSVILNERLSMAASDRESPLGAIRHEVERIRRRELERAARLNPELPLSTLDTITRSLVNQIFHQPSKRLRDFDNQELAEAFADLFRAAPELEDTDDGE